MSRLQGFKGGLSIQHRNDRPGAGTGQVISAAGGRLERLECGPRKVAEGHGCEK